MDFNEEKQNKRLAELRRKEEEDLAETLSKKYRLEYLDLSRVSINTDGLRIVGEGLARAAGIAVFGMIGKKISVAVRTPNNPKVEEVLGDLKSKGFTPTLYMVSSASLERAWERYKDLSFAIETKAGVLDISGDEIVKLLGKLKTLENVKGEIGEVIKMKKAYRISRILETVLAGSLSADASDVHVEPEEAYVRLRYRLDGVLTDILNFDRDTYSLLLSRIKLLSSLKLNIKDQAQDGRFSVSINSKDIEIRTSIIPGAYGESIVLRILNPETIALPMEELGIPANLFKILEHEIKKPNGMILTTGPTGSGKTTTLYAFMKRIHTPQVKIITIEDPIEYHLPGIVQTQVEKNYSFSQGLRSALRQDPDVIMVGEIRDGEVAETAINAALTGHLVFSTLHTNNAAGSFPRLIDLGVNPKVMSSAVSIVMAQRLVRRLCKVCKKETPLSPDSKKIVDKILKSITNKSELPENTSVVWEPVGCPECKGLGYRGRIGIYEAIRMDHEIETIINENPSEREVWSAAKPQGILTMQQDGVVKVLAGVTSLGELTRVIDLEELEESAITEPGLAAEAGGSEAPAP
ncbi:hypothetical protein A2671_00685 [Candidatus Kaiserbacteria bacterium RIFCSPHIGHO2_01_FULL_49_13]|uniref:Bacterial type II secretion system protein E domain-containing protein n=1 Tax=Candidatus Kaiserbacteria bacterium RIFCSPHIGHO2_01_FULL_49_13 TaxID=1798477 RepID=A0A1F6CFB5_9BACT|nr:MAG: hypothetical protein A2671_00685 [Candidatus Kaiserbacteria bacterium RIFCSPHIGHO2_01_FULL_49_13]